MERKVASGTMLTLLFASMLTLAFSCSVEALEYGGYEVEFRGIVISPEKWGEIVAYGSFYCEVTVVGIVYDPNGTLSLNDNVTIAYQDSLSLHIGDEVECYGTNCITCTTCPKQYYGYIVCKPTPYYVIRHPHKLLLETDKPIYKLGENVTIALANISNETIEIGGYPAWQIFTYPEEDPVYPRIFAFLAWSLNSGEIDTFIWNQYDEFTQSPAAPGKYVVKDTQGWGLHACFDIVPVVKANVDIDPDTLYLRSGEKWITAYIELSIGHDVISIDVSTITLNDTISIDPNAPMEIGDHDMNGVPDLMVKFNKTQFESHISKAPGTKYGSVTLKITGQLIDGTPLEGSDTAWVNYAGDINNDGIVNILDAALVSAHWYPGPPIGSLGYDTNTDINKDGRTDILDSAIVSSNWGQTVP